LNDRVARQQSIPTPPGIMPSVDSPDPDGIPAEPDTTRAASTPRSHSPVPDPAARQRADPQPTSSMCASLRPPFQVVTLPSYQLWMTGALVYAEQFWALDRMGLRNLRA
jgi:hypothetical protein